MPVDAALTEPVETTPAAAALLTVTKGQPTAEELAAVTAVILAMQGGGETATTQPAPRTWVRRARLNLPPRPGAGAWRRSAR